MVSEFLSHRPVCVLQARSASSVGSPPSSRGSTSDRLVAHLRPSEVDTHLAHDPPPPGSQPPLLGLRSYPAVGTPSASVFIVVVVFSFLQLSNRLMDWRWQRASRRRCCPPTPAECWPSARSWRTFLLSVFTIPSVLF